MKLEPTKQYIGIGASSEVYLANITFNFINS
jgi:hypothetical protein